MKKLLCALALVLLTTPARAGTTQVQMSLAPASHTCDPIYSCLVGSCVGIGGSCTTNADCTSCTVTAEHCSTNADCSVPLVSPSSKVQITGTGKAKLTIKGVTTTGGALVTTDGMVNTADDYIAVVRYLGIGVKKIFALKIELKNGSGHVTVDLSALLPPTGTAVVPFVTLRRPPQNPASCPGTNSPADIVSRGETTGCEDGNVLAFSGLSGGA